MRKSTWACLLAFIVNCFIVYGQENYTLTGSIKTTSNTPIQGARIKVLGKDIETATDEKGQFKLIKLAKGQYELEVYSIGYFPKKQSVKIPTDNNKPLSILLQEDLQQINTVTVEGKSMLCQYTLILKT